MIAFVITFCLVIGFLLWRRAPDMTIGDVITGMIMAAAGIAVFGPLINYLWKLL